jgi:RimJ/RimL family protein N-acetyltransferase
VLTGDLVTLRTVVEGDHGVLFEMDSTLDGWESRSGRPPQPLTRDQWLRHHQQTLEDHHAVRFAIEAGAQTVGRCDLYGIDEFAQHSQCGIALHESARGRGYGTDALRVLMGYAFERRNLVRVGLHVLASNAPAIACYRKVGFVEEGRLRKSAWVAGAFVDEVVMGLLCEEWSA